MTILPSPNEFRISRRSVLMGTGALVMSFSALSRALAQQAATAEAAAAPEPPELPGSLNDARFLDNWIRIDADGTITVFTGKAELGQGIRTALIQVAAEELRVEPADITLITADTAKTADEGFTAGSQSMQNSGTAIRHAAAQVREILIAEAAIHFGINASDFQAEGGVVVGPGGRSIGYGELVSAELLHVEAQPESSLTAPDALRIIGTHVPRVDIPAKVTGGVAYVHDIRLDGMVHARVVRPPSYGARLANVDTSAVEAMSGVVSIVRDGSFLAVVAEGEFQAVLAMRALAEAAEWEETPTLPDETNLPADLEALETEVGVVAEEGSAEITGGQVFEATFTRPYQMHASMGPSCAVALAEEEGMTIWSHTQGVYPDREAIAEMLGMPQEQLRVIHVEGAGCYGHNGADDAAADAALIARTLPGRPVRVQWMREQEHAWEPFGPGMVIKVAASVGDDGRVANWNFDLWSQTHSGRPGGAGALLAAQSMEQAFEPQVPKLNISANGNGDRNANPLAYNFPNKRVLWHFIQDNPLRVSALRALGAYANVFALESTMEELALMSGADPVEFRLAHMEDERARAVVELTAEKFGWSDEALPAGRGRGFGYARYKNSACYLAIAIEAEVDRETGRIHVLRAISAIDSGQAVSFDGIKNQTEGGILQAISWTLYEAVTFNDTRITSVDWASYPIMRFQSVPDLVEVHVIDRPGERFLGTGEGAQGPAAAALANAVRHAIGTRIYDLPFSRERVKQAIGV